MIDEKKVIAVIRAEQKLIGGKLVGTVECKLPKGKKKTKACKSPGHCAIGALLYAAGFPNEKLDRIKPHPNDWGDNSQMMRTLQAEYGLTKSQASRIVNANDEQDDPGTEVDGEEKKTPTLAAVRKVFRERQREVIDEVRALAEEERNEIRHFVANGPSEIARLRREHENNETYHKMYVNRAKLSQKQLAVAERKMVEYKAIVAKWDKHKVTT